MKQNANSANMFVRRNPRSHLGTQAPHTASQRKTKRPGPSGDLAAYEKSQLRRPSYQITEKLFPEDVCPLVTVTESVSEPPLMLESNKVTVYVPAASEPKE
jgi:hypothetical protein